MSGSTESLTRKISGANDLQGVVLSMKALAASSIGQYEKAVKSLDDYYRTVELGLSVCLHKSDQASLSITGRPKPSGVVGAVVFGSDQGLVGRFNDTLAEFTIDKLKTLPGKTTKIWAVGDRMRALLTETAPTEPSLLAVPISVRGITPFVGQILNQIETAREDGEVAEVYVFHNHWQSGTSYEPACKQLLPLEHLWQSKLAKLQWPTKDLAQVIGGIGPTLEAFVREYLFVLLYQACAESLASENASRLAAMQRAEKNIDNILESLNSTFHRIRQASIDEELFDVISGFDALSKSKPGKATI
jgi:F-type H+-transporting ATPase subunit gamma